MCLSVSLVCSLVCSLLPLMYIIRSRKAISVGEIALVNLTVGWTVFKCFMNSNSEFLPCGQIISDIIVSICCGLDIKLGGLKCYSPRRIDFIVAKCIII